ncbi:MAG TPA: hypothetical protein VFN09_03520, partial [Rhodanobacteraceae bacterium]|nr:hypothetical protein [Rhodanobacteraceae bacterium]
NDLGGTCLRRSHARAALKDSQSVGVSAPAISTQTGAVAFVPLYQRCLNSPLSKRKLETMETGLRKSRPVRHAVIRPGAHTDTPGETVVYRHDVVGVRIFHNL